MAAWLVASIDKFHPALISQWRRQHPSPLELPRILNGLTSFGPLGLLIGPLVLSLCVSAFRIYEMDVLRAPTPAATPASGEPAGLRAQMAAAAGVMQKGMPGESK
jgi:hypothetical protein